MIIHEEYPIKIFTKKYNLYIYNFSKPFRAETTKIIIKKYKFLRKNEEDDDYWEFIINKIVKLSIFLFFSKNNFNIGILC